MKWKPGESGSVEYQFKPGHPYRWPKGVSGCPGGKPKSRREFESKFYEALMNEGDPTEAAQLLWKCARDKEPWAVQLLLQRIAPIDSKIKVEVSRQDEIDFSRLTDAELEGLERILERARPVAAIESGAMPTEPEDVH